MPLGPIMPRQLENTTSTPCSRHVGTSASMPGKRCSAATPMARSRPAATCAATSEAGATVASTCPPITAVTASPEPAKPRHRERSRGGVLLNPGDEPPAGPDGRAAIDREGDLLVDEQRDRGEIAVAQGAVAGNFIGE